LKLECGEALSTFAFRFNLRRYMMVVAELGRDGAAEVPRYGCETATAPATSRWGLPEKSRFRYIAWVKCPYRVADKTSALRAGERAPG